MGEGRNARAAQDADPNIPSHFHRHLPAAREITTIGKRRLREVLPQLEIGQGISGIATLPASSEDGSQLPPGVGGPGPLVLAQSPRREGVFQHRLHMAWRAERGCTSRGGRQRVFLM